MNIRPDFETFRMRAQQGNLVPVWQEILADLETPVSVFRKLADNPYAFLLESVEGGEQIARYSFIGIDPFLIFRARGNEQSLDLQRGRCDIAAAATPVGTLRAILAHFTPVSDPDLPPFSGGAVGYMAYDTVRYFENIPDENPDELDLPDCLFMLADAVVAFDHVKHRMVLVVNAQIHEDDDLRAVYDEALTRLQDLRERVTAIPSPAPARTGKPSLPLETRSNFTREQFEEIVRRSKDYITEGDIFQVVQSQRLSARFTCHPFDIYRALRAVNPSPYMFYLKCDDLILAGSSPEILVRCNSGKVTVRPIAGTRPRGATPGEDKAFEQELLADVKERAEHVMLVDLGRNDIGRVCTYGTVHVDEFMVIERYSHVMHIVSNVVGDLAEGNDALDVLGACFPAGTVSGAPKIRAMEIIDELENVRRGPYAGSVVYFDFDGAMDSCITIRTAVIKGDQVHVQAGAGIVADSVPASEYQETLNKARGLLRAIEWAESGLE
ncbi:MAG: anthranilate synthase component [Candidatus Sumerlaeota bacterium]|nr:anthranilate synthase component [Candidatus Sumerlaeota bacterium]